MSGVQLLSSLPLNTLSAEEGEGLASVPNLRDGVEYLRHADLDVKGRVVLSDRL